MKNGGASALQSQALQEKATWQLFKTYSTAQVQGHSGRTQIIIYLKIR